MAARAGRYKPIAEQIRVVQQETAELMHAALVETALREHGAVMRTPPVPGRFIRRVDGQTGRSEEDVSPYGVIQYNYFRLDDVVRYAMDVLFDKSPVYKDEYRRSHMLFLEDKAVTDLTEWQPGMEITILNPVPYSRKIELGKMQMRVPGTDHVYEQAATAVRARYGNVAQIIFTFRASVRGAREIMRYGHGSNISNRTIRNGFASIERENRVPALVIREYSAMGEGG